MADRPIPFSAPMVRALIDGRKTQTRRVLNPPYGTLELTRAGWRPIYIRAFPGDRLYLREAWRAEYRFNDRPPRDIPPGEAVQYLADDPLSPWDSRYRHARFMPRWASRLTLTVTDVRVQRLQDISTADCIAEGISANLHDAMEAAGTSDKARRHAYHDTYASGYRALWNSLHGPDAWDANPWVAALTFTVDQRNIDAGGA